MPNIEDELKRIRFRTLDAHERDGVWKTIVTRRAESVSAASFNFGLKPMTALLVALAVLFSGTGVVVASDAAKPGDALFGVDLALERVRISLASEERRNEIAREQAQERLEEIQKLRGDGSVDDDQSIDGQVMTVTEIEADVFTNETVVKLEINDRKFGFITSARTREAIVDEIVAKYDLEKAVVEVALVLETENRASRPDDKEFLNSEVRAGAEIELDDDEKDDIRIGLDQVLRVLGEDEVSGSADLRAALQGILDSSATGKIRIESDGQRVEFKFKDGSIEMKVKSEDSSDDDSDDDSDDNRGRGSDDSDDEENDDDSDDNDDDEDDNSGSSHGGDDEDDEVEVKIKL